MSDPLRVRAKICGITTPEDALEAARLGADALGFNGWHGSKRFLDLRAASAWLRSLPPFVCRVAVLVDAPAGEADAIAALPGIDALQFHGDESPEYCARFLERGVSCIKALRLADASGIRRLGDFPPAIPVLIDAAVPGAYGGTGHGIDFGLAREFVAAAAERPVILAGGLTPENVGEAVRRVRPFGVDVASGVEHSPGRKDGDKMRRFLKAVRP